MKKTKNKEKSNSSSVSVNATDASPLLKKFGTVQSTRQIHSSASDSRSTWRFMESLLSLTYGTLLTILISSALVSGCLAARSVELKEERQVKLASMIMLDSTRDNYVFYDYADYERVNHTFACYDMETKADCTPECMNFTATNINVTADERCWANDLGYYSTLGIDRFRGVGSCHCIAMQFGTTSFIMQDRVYSSPYCERAKAEDAALGSGSYGGYDGFCMWSWECRETDDAADITIATGPKNYNQFKLLGPRSSYCQENCEVKGDEDTAVKMGCYAAENSMLCGTFPTLPHNSGGAGPDGEKCYCVPKFKAPTAFLDPNKKNVQTVESSSEYTGSYQCKQGSLPSENCEKSCIWGSGSLTCDGDSFYCSDYSCTTGGVCYCSSVAVTTISVLITDSGDKEYENHNHATILGLNDNVTIFCSEEAASPVIPGSVPEVEEVTTSLSPSPSASRTPSVTPSVTPPISLSPTWLPERKRDARSDGWFGRNLLSIEEPVKEEIQQHKLMKQPKLKNSRKRELEHGVECAAGDDCSESLTPLSECGVRMYVKLQDHQMNFYTHPNTAGLIALKKRGYFESLEIGGRLITDLPDSLWVSTGDLEITYLVNGSCYETKSITILAESVCKLKDCLFCMETVHSWKCMTNSQRTVLVLVMIAILLAIIVFIPTIVWISYWLFSGLWFILKTPIMVVWSICKSQFSSDVMSLAKRIWRMKDYFRARRGVQMPRGSKLGFMMLFGLVCVVSSCDTGLLIPVTLENCVMVSQTTQQCDMTLESELTLQNVGSVGCFSLTSNGTVIAQINVTYSKMIETVDVIYDYCTASWSGYWESNTHCDQDGGCPGECLAVIPKGGTDKLITPEVNDYPGFEGCKRTCGCAECGCFLCSDACTWYGFGIVPSGEAYDVASLGVAQFTPEINISVSGSSLDNTFSDFYIGQPFDVSGIVFDIIGSLSQPSEPIFDEVKLIWLDLNHAWIGPASEVNAPTKGTIGDIQANRDPNTGACNIALASPTAFAFDASVAQEDDEENKIKYLFVDPGLNVLSGYQMLPSVFDGEYWYWDDITELMTSNLQTAGALVLSVQTTGSVTITREVSLVCPEAKLLNASGCVECPQDVSIVISASSNCLGGFVTLYEDDKDFQLLTMSLNLDVEETTYTIYGTTTDKDNSFKLTLIGSGGNATVNVDFTAVVVDPVVTNGTISQGNGTKHRKNGIKGWSKNFGKDVDRFFKDLVKDPFKSSWWKWLAFIGGVIVLLVILWFAWPILLTGYQMLAIPLTVLYNRIKWGKQKSL